MPKEEINLSHFHSLLLKLREELIDVTATADAAAGTVELDQTRQGRLSRMDALQQQAMSVETNRRRGVALTRINAALRRIDEEDYGYCITCDKPIAPRRLEIEPTATQCIRCAEASASR